MDFLQTIAATLLYGDLKLPILLFLLSAVLLIAGVALRAWSVAMRLSSLENRPINWIEHTHPHLPSVRFILTIALCGTILIIAALQTMQGTFPFNDPYHGLNLTSFFLLGTAIGVLAELQWKGAGQYALSVLAGTAIAFLLIVTQFSGMHRGVAERAVLLLLLVPTILFTGYEFMAGKQFRFALTATAAFFFWMFIYLSSL